MRTLHLVFGCFAIAGVLRAQTPAFEVASIKANKSEERPANAVQAGGRYVAKRVTLRQVIRLAYVPLLPPQIVGGPSWIDSDRFDIEARASGNPSGDEMRAMIKTLLADRFTLRVHAEQRDTSIYALVLARSDGKLGSKLQRSALDCSNPSAATQSPAPVDPAAAPQCGFRLGIRAFTNGAPVQMMITGKGVTMTQIATQLSSMGPVGRMVIDRTGLMGGFDVDLQASSDTSGTAAAVPSDVPSLFTALPEQLGLKLESTTGAIDFLVIDDAEHPTEN
jgi:uncharacterized protein (TIGR03435 family)